MSSHPLRKSRWSASRVAYYLLAAILPPFMIGVLLTFMILKDLLIPHAPEVLPETAKASIPATPARFTRPVALIVLGSGGVQSTEVLASAAVLARSRKFEIVTASARREIVRSSAGVEFYPHTTFTEAPAPELLVIPSWIGEPSPGELEAIRRLSERASRVLALGDGARMLASAGFLQDKEATAHPAGRESLERTHPEVRWTWDRSFVRDGKWITSGGVFQSIPAALEAIRATSNTVLAAQTAHLLGWQPEDARVPSGLAHVRWADWLPMTLHGGFAWGRTSIGIVLSPGLDDLALAAAADTYPRTLSARTVLLAPKREVIRTGAGLLVVPNIPSTQAPPLDELILPGNDGALAGTAEAPHKWTLSGPISQSLRLVFDRLADTEGAWITAFVARMTRYSWPGGSLWSGRVPHLLLRVLFISLFGVTLAWFLERRVQSKYARVR